MNSPKPGIYHHFKDPNKHYEVLGVGMHTETKERFVIYKALYDEGTIFLRPETMFMEEVDKPELGYKGPRFIFIREKA